MPNFEGVPETPKPVSEEQKRLDDREHINDINRRIAGKRIEVGDEVYIDTRSGDRVGGKYIRENRSGDPTGRSLEEEVIIDEGENGLRKVSKLDIVRIGKTTRQEIKNTAELRKRQADEKSRIADIKKKMGADEEKK